jgi:DNA-binding XRE family transcriptional regulator
MTKVQIIKTAGGEDLVVLQKSEYERLTALAVGEDAGTARIVRQARAALASGNEIMVPKVVVDRLSNGENPIRVLREWREMTQAELVGAIGITQGYLSELEAGKRKGPLVLHQKIARELEVPIDLLLPIAVSDQEADPARFARRQRVVEETKRSRRKR